MNSKTTLSSNALAPRRQRAHLPLLIPTKDDSMTDEDQYILSDYALWSPHSDGAVADRRRQAIVELKNRYDCKHFTMTRVDGGIWVEAWREIPKFEGEFNAAHAGKVAVTIHNFRHLI